MPPKHGVATKTNGWDIVPPKETKKITKRGPFGRCDQDTPPRRTVIFILPAYTTPTRIAAASRLPNRSIRHGYSAIGLITTRLTQNSLRLSLPSGSLSKDFFLLVLCIVVATARRCLP